MTRRNAFPVFVRRCIATGIAGIAALACASLQAQTQRIQVSPGGPVVEMPGAPKTPKAPKPRALAAATGDSISVAYHKGQVPVAPGAITALGTDLFGDKLNLFNGSFSFEHTDVELPGNNALPVALVRTHSPGRQPLVRGAMGDWDVSTPRIEGTFSVATGWVPIYGTAATRCSGFNMPPYVSVQGVDGAVDFEPHEYWGGTNLVIPGQGSQEILTRAADNAQAPTDGGSYPLVTQQNWQIGCLASVQNATGQGFFAVSPQGVRYQFNWMASRDNSSIRKSAYLPRKDFYLMATRVSDRFGNWVDYTYDPAKPLNLTRIQSSDGRVITLSYANGRVSSVSDGTRTWTYQYSALTDLQSVQLPDGSRWQFNLRQLMNLNSTISEGWRDCDADVVVEGLGGTGIGSITHPSGAVGTFTASQRIQGRTNVTRVCTYDLVSGWTNGNVWPRATFNQALASKQISGPGLPTMTWQYAGEESLGEWAPCSVCRHIKHVWVTEPSGAVTRHTFGVQWRVNEGQLLRVEEGFVPANGTALRTTDAAYYAGPPFPDGFGNSVNFMTDWVSTRNRPQHSRLITQQGTQFSWTASSFDIRARPVTVIKSGPGGSRTETTTYADFTDRWVLGQVDTVSANGLVPLDNEYDSLGRLTAQKAFGLTQFTQTFYTDGTLATRADGKGNTTTFSSYHRGIPRSIQFPLGVSVSGEVSNIGRLTRITDPMKFITTYGYDAMGRLASITPPGGFTATTLSFAPSSVAAFGLPAGHWQQTSSKGNARTVTYYDALWRPVMTRTFDAANQANTRTVLVKGYDAGGRLAFESYPQRDISSFAATSPGKRFLYDNLNRQTRMAADSEHGELYTHTAYLSAFETQITNPRGKVSTQGFWALDNPAEVQLAKLKLPHNVTVTIPRDAFGKPLSITRGDGSVSLTRSYVYDTHQRLCKTVEPELIATVQAWDLAGNLAWRAPGVNLPSTDPGRCDTASVPATAKISHGYDALNRLELTSYGDGSNSVVRTYFNDGKPQTVNSGGANWTYAYNALRQLTSESLNYNGQTFAFSRGYDSLGNLSTLSYPSGVSLSYAPNALGQPTQVRNTVAGVHYASSISHHAGGSVAGFSYGNGLVFAQGLNPRQLPQTLQHGSLVSDTYGYDANGNVSSISDGAEAGATSRSMSYDDLDRLWTANGIWGAGSYTYDALDNLRTATVGSRNTVISIGSNNLITSISHNGVSQAISNDARGNISVFGVKTYGFDLGNRMLSASPGGGSYGYDGHGRRVRIISSDGSTRYQVYSHGGQLLWSTNAGGGRPTSNTAYIHLGGKQIAEWDSVKGVQYVHTDALGSPVAHSAPTGSLLRRTRYEPYGSVVVTAGSAPSAATSQVGFTGHVQDLESGLVYMQQRYYHSHAGRFMSVDPVVTDANTGGHFNRYNYAENNPYKYTDPDGNSPAHAAAFAFGFAIDVGAQMLVEGKSFSNVSFKDAALSGLGAAITGGIGGRLATSALQGAITAGQAVAGTAAAGAVTGAAVSAASDLVKGETPSAAKMAIGAAGGAAGAAVGGKIANSAAASLASNAARPGIAGHIGQTTQAAAQLGGKVVVPTSVGQELGKTGADAAAAGASKLAEKQLGR